MGLYWDNGKENGNYYIMELHRDYMGLYIYIYIWLTSALYVIILGRYTGYTGIIHPQDEGFDIRRCILLPYLCPAAVSV